MMLRKTPKLDTMSQKICEAKQIELWMLLKYKSFITEEQRDKQ